MCSWPGTPDAAVEAGMQMMVEGKEKGVMKCIFYTELAGMPELSTSSSQLWLQYLITALPLFAIRIII